ncbi:MAG: hypothetical protein IBJ15_22325 [Alphaproteobacteria bacterium]|nr:hypothetical protein [Alphaproteobacteria bacterium]
MVGDLREIRIAADASHGAEARRFVIRERYPATRGDRTDVAAVIVAARNVSQYSIRKIEWRDADLPRENTPAPDGWRRDPDGSPSIFLPNLGRASLARPFLLQPASLPFRKSESRLRFSKSAAIRPRA